MAPIDRRHFIKLSAGLGTALLMAGCQTLLDKLKPLEPTPPIGLRPTAVTLSAQSPLATPAVAKKNFAADVP